MMSSRPMRCSTSRRQARPRSCSPDRRRVRRTAMDVDPQTTLSDNRFGDTLFGSLQRSASLVSSDRRALAGLRGGDTWVELTYRELVSDVVTVSEHLSELGIGK